MQKHHEGKNGRRRRRLRRWESSPGNQERRGSVGALHRAPAGGVLTTSKIEQDSADRKLAKLRKLGRWRPMHSRRTTNQQRHPHFWPTRSTQSAPSRSVQSFSLPKRRSSALHAGLPISRYCSSSAPTAVRASPACQHLFLPCTQVRSAAQLHVSRETK